MESSMSKLNLSVAVGPASQDEAAKTTIVGADREYNSQSLIDPDCEYQCEYREDIWKNLLQQEAEKPPIHLQSPQLEFRGTLVQQLREVTKKLGLGLATLHSAVAQLDLFMDAHRLRADRLTHVALACLSIAAKSEEKSSRAPTLKTLSKLSGVNLCGKTFRQLEWMVGQHIKWKLLAPTPVTFAALLVQFVVMDSDLTTRHPKFVRRFKRDGGKLLDAYLDLTLSDVRLKVVESVDVGCACVVCARTDLGLCAWPPALAVAAGRQYTTVAPIARRLQRMMQILKARESTDSEVDQGYGSARTSPNQTPSTSPRTQTQVSHGTSTCCSSTSYVTQCEDSNHRPTERPEYSILDMDDTNFRPPPAPEQQVPVDMTCHRVYNPECSKFCIYCRSSRLLDASLETVQPTTSVAVKRGTDTNIDFENKRYRLISQAVL